MGVTVRRKNNNKDEWWVFISHQGIRRSKKVGPKKVAEKVAEEIRARLVAGSI